MGRKFSFTDWFGHFTLHWPNESVTLCKVAVGWLSLEPHELDWLIRSCSNEHDQMNRSFQSRSSSSQHHRLIRSSSHGHDRMDRSFQNHLLLPLLTEWFSVLLCPNWIDLTIALISVLPLFCFISSWIFYTWSFEWLPLHPWNLKNTFKDISWQNVSPNGYVVIRSPKSQIMA